MPTLNLTAVYTPPASDPLGPHTFTRPLPSTASRLDQPTLSSKTQHLSDLCAAITSLQEEVNSYLTARMEEEKTRSSAPEAVEEGLEEKYGEEDPGEEDPGEDEKGK
ncbi:hypothetical protein RUND412_000851 [Rhizina undulata]